MGDIYFIHAFRSWRDPKDTKLREPKLEIIRSEDFQSWLTVNGNRVLNTTFGIWFYEGNLLNEKQKLKKDLRNLIKMIDDL